MSDVLNELSEPFPAEVERTMTKGGTQLTYIPVSEVITRLNNVLGVENWSYQVRSCQRDPDLRDWIIAHVTLTVSIDDYDITKDGFGGQEIKYMKSGKAVDLGNEYKGAVSDALKKAAQAIGVGIYLARSEDSLQLEQAIAEEEAVNPEIREAWDNFVELAAGLSDVERDGLNTFWTVFAPGQPKPNLQTATIDDLTALHGEIVRMTFGAEVVEAEAPGQ
tara:strand:+ start:2866 stop:3525 length:660 start_codon:yes stop_codon:yes gene_type:complete